jgi:hypothetical protein
MTERAAIGETLEGEILPGEPPDDEPENDRPTDDLVAALLDGMTEDELLNALGPSDADAPRPRTMLIRTRVATSPMFRLLDVEIEGEPERNGVEGILPADAFSVLYGPPRCKSFWRLTGPSWRVGAPGGDTR